MKYNFYAGPAILPQEVLKEAAQAVISFGNTGLSILEISHRSKEFIAVMDEAVDLVKELMNIGDEYAIMFLSGGASSQFYMAPMNILNDNEYAAYVDTGTWSSKAIKEAKLYGNIEVLASSKDANYSYIPKDLKIDDKFKYLHLTSNNTIFGTQYKSFPKTNVPLICDMSSDIFSKEIDINKFDLIYAGAQKNMGPAGTTLVIVKKSALGKVSRPIPSMLKYENHIESGSMYNTPPVYSVFVSMLTLRWIKAQGGLKAMEKRNNEKASKLYNEIDRNKLFFSPTNVEDRSFMNICFKLHDENLEKEFLEQSNQAGCVGLEGHRSVGGFRASIYNAMSINGIKVLVDMMKEFEAIHG